MRDPQRQLARLAAIAVVLIAADRVSAFSYFLYGSVPVVWAGKQSVRYLSPTSFPEGSDAQMNLIVGMGLWNLVPASDFRYFYDPNGLDTIDNYDGYNDTIAAELDPGVLGVTYMVNQSGYWYDMDMAFSPLPGGVGWTFETNPDCDVIANPAPNNGYSLLLVATHELGHALGLGHDPLGTESPGTAWFIATMNPRYPSGGPVGQENIIELHTDDRGGVRFLYPHSGPSGAPVRDLASAGYTSGTIIGKAVPIYFSPATVDPGGVVTLRSVIENFGTTNEFYVRQGFYLSTDAVIETSDTLLGFLQWDLAFGDAFEFDVEADLPADLPAGTYHLGSILDDLNAVAELYEDNNAVGYCSALTVRRLAPVINNLGQFVVPCGQPFTGPTPTVTHPLNMAPITWSLDNPQLGMTINPTTGVISWPSPARSPFQYTIYVRATNSAGTATQILFLGVTESSPLIEPIADATGLCGAPHTGPTPQMTSPACMTPIINWSLDAAPAGMTIDHDTGVVSWLAPVASSTPYVIMIRATNAVGNGTTTWRLTVRPGDLNGDGQININDLDGFTTCLAGPEQSLGSGCLCADADGDDDVDLVDFAALQDALSTL